MERVAIKLEFIFKASPAMLYKFITTPSCIVRWFCDEVEIDKNNYIFIWDGAEEEAELVEDHEDQLLRFKMMDYEDEEYLEFSMSKSPVTNETILEITDFCDSDETEDQRQLWESQIENLRRELGG